jgi:hypothetical protein
VYKHHPISSAKAFVYVLSMPLLCLAATSSASAVCDATCEQSANHWSFEWNPNIGGKTDDIVLGMIFLSPVGWIPAACDLTDGSLSATPMAYTDRQLTNDTSMCTGGSGDSVRFLAPDQIDPKMISL